MISFRDKSLISINYLAKLNRMSKVSKMSFLEFIKSGRLQTRNWRRMSL